MGPEMVKRFLMAARAWGHPGYNDMYIEELMHLCLHYTIAYLDAYLVRMRRNVAFRATVDGIPFIREVEYPHRRSINEANFQLAMSNVSTVLHKAASSEHSGEINWWRCPRRQSEIEGVATAMLAAMPTGQGELPGVPLTTAIMGVCDHFSDASHGNPYRGNRPTAPLDFVDAMCHHMGWCDRCQGAESSGGEPSP